MSTKELFLEIGTEEIPAGFIPRAMAEMEVYGNVAFVLDNQVLATIQGKQGLEDVLKKLP